MKNLKPIFYRILVKNIKEIEELLKQDEEFGKMVVNSIEDKPTPLPIENLAYINNNLVGTVPFEYVFTCTNFTLLEKLIIQKSFYPNENIKLETEQVNFNIQEETVNEVLHFYQQSNFDIDNFLSKLERADRLINDMLKNFSDKCYEQKSILAKAIIEDTLNKYLKDE